MKYLGFNASGKYQIFTPGGAGGTWKHSILVQERMLTSAGFVFKKQPILTLDKLIPKI